MMGGREKMPILFVGNLDIADLQTATCQLLTGKDLGTSGCLMSDAPEMRLTYMIVLLTVGV
jgi:hypothetical protein